MQFMKQLSKIANTGQARSVVLHGNVHDIYFDGVQWVPLTDMLLSKLKAESSGTQKGITQIVYRVNNPVEVVGQANLDDLNFCWGRLRGDTKSLPQRLSETLDNSVYAFELMRQMMMVSRSGKLKNNLLIIVEAADMLLPEAPIAHMGPADRKRVAVVKDWFSDPLFTTGNDTVVLLADSRSAIHSRISRLPQVLSVEVPLPSKEDRLQFLQFHHGAELLPKETDVESVAENTSGLSQHALRQLVMSGDLSGENISKKVEEYIVSQLGEGVVEFKRPKHSLKDIIGFRRLKKFTLEKLIPAFLAEGKDAMSGCLVGGPIGGGKTFFCEAIANELGGLPVLIIKNIRSKWYGETDQTIERLQRLLKSFYKVVIFVDEADTVFGAIDSDQDTEKRATGKFQAMMSDPEMRGRVIWFLMTARIHLLSPDIRRPGRMDLILPILDPDKSWEGGEERQEFFQWATGMDRFGGDEGKAVYELTQNWSSASYALLRSRVKQEKADTKEKVLEIIRDIIPPDIEDVRRYQTLQAMVNCTRRSLLVGPDVNDYKFAEMRREWKSEIAQLEKRGIK